ncbi:MAG: AMP-dependent synthetase/ligase [Isosphaeraceae bacterium]
MSLTNLSALHRATAERLGPRTALRFKKELLYHELSWTDYRRRADLAAAGLIERGLQVGERVGLLAENSADWLTADIAILATGAADVPIHAPSAPSQVEYQLRHSGARGVIVSGQAQADKVLAVLDRLPDLEWLVSFTPVRVSGQISQVTWEGLIHEGSRQGAYGAGQVGKREQSTGLEALATIIYTSGTTGNPKGVMLTHGNLLSNAESTFANDPLRSDDVLLSWLPYSHIYARTVDHYLSILGGVTVCLADSPESLVLNIAETQPSWLTAVPRFYEKVWASVEPLPREARDATLRKIFGPRIRQLTSGGAPLPGHLADGFIAAGLPLYEGYGLTESSPVISFNSQKRHKIGTVGPAIPGVEIKLAEDGEILTRGPHVMKGYWKDEDATRQAIVDGWLLTGDVGRIDGDGFLTITDRKKDLIITSGGKNLSPGELERLLTRDALIDQAVVYGDGKPFATALIVPNFERLQAALDASPGSLGIKEPFVVDEKANTLMKQRVDELMRTVSQPERIKAFLLLAHPFQMENDEMTSTMKVRRRHIIDKYRDRLDALYESGRRTTGPTSIP